VVTYVYPYNFFTLKNKGDEATNVDTEDDWEFVKFGDQQSFGIKTSGLEDKCTACEMLVCYARELKGAFSDYVEDVIGQFVSNLIKNGVLHTYVRIGGAA